MIEAEKAWQLIRERMSPGAVKKCTIRGALHHYLASPLAADRDIPACNRAAMDGYAVKAVNLETAPVLLDVVGDVTAGSPSVPAVGDGECVRIYTGARVPPDTDTVVMIEDTELAPDTFPGDRVRFLQSPEHGEHIFRRGENALCGDVVVTAGTRLNATRLGLCAMVGVVAPEVHAMPRVAILSTGTELKDAGDQIADHEIRDSNAPMIASLLVANNFPFSTMQRVPDDVDTIQESIVAQLEESYDFILVTGGISAGKYDLVPVAIEKAGGTIHYHGVNIEPGKPQLFASFIAGQHVFGLSGNPRSAMTGMHEFVLPALRRRSGCSLDQCRPLLHLPLGSDLQVKGERQHHVLGKLVACNRTTIVNPVSSVGSADLVAAGQADGAIIVPSGVTRLTAGTTVAFRPWDGVV